MSRRRQRMYWGVMAVCATALLVDRVFLHNSVTEPSPADAAVVTAKAHDDVRADMPKPQPIPELPFPRGLTPIESVAGFRDIFSPSDNRSHKQAVANPDSSEPTQSRESVRASFASRYRLEAVLEGEGLEIAIVNGHWLRVGQSLGGCELRSIAGTEVRFLCVDGEALLALPDSLTPRPD